MHVSLSILGLMLGLATLASCKHAPDTRIPDSKMCNLSLKSIETRLPPNPVIHPDDIDQIKTVATTERVVEEDSYLDHLLRAVESGIYPVKEGVRVEPEPLLFLSGGSQHGAFGAGYLDQWAKERGGLPTFSVVTGVSVGSLLSTAAFINQPQLAVDVGQINEESDLLDAYVDGKDVRDGFSLRAVRALVQKGAVGDLEGLRDELDTALSPTVLQAVADRAKGGLAGRKLFVGVTDLDKGQAYAVDMTELATRYSEDPDNSAHLKTCYREVLIASSMVPASAKPVFIDNRMYADGGVRFSVFGPPTEELMPAIIRAEAARRPAPGAPKEWLLHIILNGDGEPSPRCGKADDKHCKDDVAVPGSENEPHADWDIAGVALRSVSLLINQVQRLSIEKAQHYQDIQPDELAFVRIIEKDRDAHLMDASELTDELARQGYTGERTCEEWRDEDILKEDPVEFHARYMHCLISYGRTLAKTRFEVRKTTP